MEITKVYLSGGMNESDWQSNLIKELPNGFVFFNPREHNLMHTKEYTFWDLYYVKNCDIVFGYMQKDNPSGFGLTLEVGYASALGKPIILVDERSEHDQKFAASFSIVRETATIVFSEYKEGLEFLSKIRNGIIPSGAL